MAFEKAEFLTGDYAQRLDALYSAASMAREDTTPQTMLDGDPYASLRDEYEVLKAEALEAAAAADRVVHLAGIRRPKWRELKAKYPPRTEGPKETLDGDRLAGLNTDAAEDDIVYESIKAWETETGERVRFATSRASFDEWADGLTDGEWQVLVIRAWTATNGARFDPKSLPASRTPSID